MSRLVELVHALLTSIAILATFAMFLESLIQLYYNYVHLCTPKNPGLMFKSCISGLAYSWPVFAFVS